MAGVKGVVGMPMANAASRPKGHGIKQQHQEREMWWSGKVDSGTDVYLPKYTTVASKYGLPSVASQASFHRQVEATGGADGAVPQVFLFRTASELSSATRQRELPNVTA